MVTFEQVIHNKELQIYIEKGNEFLGEIGITDHSKVHTMKVANDAATILKKLGYDERTCELAKITGYLHDIGNMINRIDHEKSGALIAFIALQQMGMDPTEIAIVVGAIGNHDERTGSPISPVNAAVVIADKADVRSSRVRNPNLSYLDIHDRVNHAVKKAELIVDTSKERKEITLDLTIDTNVCPVLDYFEIFLTRMIMCKKAANYLDTWFNLVVNDAVLL